MATDTVLQTLLSWGTPSIGFAFLYVFQQKHFESLKEERNNYKEQMADLCRKIEKMSDVIQEFTACQIQKGILLDKRVEDVEEMFANIKQEEDLIKKTVEETNLLVKLCPNQKEVTR